MRPPTDDPILEATARDVALSEYDEFAPCPVCFQPGPGERWWEDDG